MYREVVAASHLHTAMSDGQATLADVVDAARTEGIDAVIVTDHETLGHDVNDWAGSVLVVTGEEVTPGYREQIDDRGRITASSSSNHLVALAIDRPIDSRGASPQTVIDQVREQGGMSFLAHPEDADSPWDDWSAQDATGLEIWNFKTAWKRGLQSAPTGTFGWRNPDAVMAGPAPEVLARWDTIGLQRRVVGLGGSDNHASPAVIDGIERCVVPWYLGISAIVNHIWVDAAAFDAAPVGALMDAVRDGRVLVAHHGVAPARTFRATVRSSTPSGTVRRWPGEEFAFETGQHLEVESPRPASLRIIRDGTLVAGSSGAQLEHAIDRPGVWRVEASLADRPWVYSNPFYVRDPAVST